MSSRSQETKRGCKIKQGKLLRLTISIRIKLRLHRMIQNVSVYLNQNIQSPFVKQEYLTPPWFASIVHPPGFEVVVRCRSLNFLVQHLITG